MNGKGDLRAKIERSTNAQINEEDVHAVRLLLLVFVASRYCSMG
ncbi:hypothetical protein [uncultured Slackia sp.]|nr:hypothetical protein [uncultured Slackia sp.]